MEIAADAPLAAPGRRLGQFLLDLVVLAIPCYVGYGIGHLIWSPRPLGYTLGAIGIAASTVPWLRGQTVGMALLSMAAVEADSRSAAGYPRMLLRQFVLFGVPILIVQLFGSTGTTTAYMQFAWIVGCFMLLWSERRQELWDHAANTQVVDLRLEVEAA